MKKRTKIWSVVSIVVLLGGTYIFFSSSLPKPVAKAPSGHYTSDQRHFLQEVGLGNTENLDLKEDYDAFTNPDIFNYYKDKLGLRYFSKPGLDKFCKTYNLIFGKTDDFKGEIPAANTAWAN
jgi:hypothetical protein